MAAATGNLTCSSRVLLGSPPTSPYHCLQQRHSSSAMFACFLGDMLAASQKMDAVQLTQHLKEIQCVGWRDGRDPGMPLVVLTTPAYQQCVSRFSSTRSSTLGRKTRLPNPSTWTVACIFHCLNCKWLRDSARAYVFFPEFHVNLASATPCPNTWHNVLSRGTVDSTRRKGRVRSPVMGTEEFSKNASKM